MEASFYPYLGALCWIGMLLMLGTLIRAKVPLFQKLLFPSSLIGGLIGFVLINLDLVGMPTSTGWKDITPNIFSMITFHLFAFGFVGIGLLQTKKPASGKVVMRGALWIALVFGMTFSVQALIGKGVFVLWQDLFGGTFETVNGYLLGAGFTQGPGQTQAYATIWQTSYQTANALSVGLAFAAATFITLIICVWFGRRSPEYGFERCLIMFGYATGTAASGLLLLRIADPDYETPVAVEGGLMNVFSCLTFLPVTLSMPFAPLPGYPIVWVFAAVIIATPIAMYLLKFIRKPAF